VLKDVQLLVLALLPGVRPRAARELRRRGLEEALAHPGEHRDLLPAQARRQLANGEAARRAESEARLASAAGIEIVGLGERAYPRHLAETYDPPIVLYVRGTIEPDAGDSSLAIVGSRSASSPGRALARCMARELAAAGFVIVSGLARGIDAAAHLGALDAAGRTVAVLGCGLDRVYPPEHAALAARIAESGALVSEFPLGTPPLPGHFPRRNRLIAGWGRAVVVVEAGARSGTLGTVRHAIDEGREVMAVPGHPSQAGAAGVNAMIRDGAALVRDASDVAGELRVTLPRAAPSRGGERLLGLLRRDAPQSLEELQDRSGLRVQELLSRLGALELAARVERLPGPLFVRS
jgi:DNA processing protein